MNINLKIKLPLVSETNPTDKKTLLVTTQLFLTPFYAVEEDVIGPFTSLKDEQLPWVRKLLFNASLTGLRLTRTIEKLNLLSSVDLFSLRRDLVICMVTNEMAKQLYKDSLNSISRAKTLGDFSVSTSTKGDSLALGKILSDSSNCVDEIKELISNIEQSGILPSTFVKGQYNPKTRHSARLWWNTDLPIKLVDGYANKKYWYNGNGYKTSDFNLDAYSKYSHYDPVAYYRHLNSSVLQEVFNIS